MGLRIGGISIELHVVSERGDQFAGRVDHVSVPGANGSLGIYHGHSPLLCLLRPGAVEITFPDGQIEMLLIDGGFMEVQPSKTTILANSCLRADELDQERAQQAMSKAQACLRSCTDQEDLRKAYAKLEIALARLRILHGEKRHL